MELKFWHDRWEQNQIGFHQSEVNSHLQKFWPTLGTPVTGRVFVPLCGKSRDMLWLRAHGHQVLGIEISPIAVRDFFLENHLEPSLTEGGRFECWESDGLAILCGDFFDLTSDDLEGVAGVYDRASLIALPPAMRPDYAAHLASISGSATTLLVTMEYPQQEMQGPPFSVDETEVRSLFCDRFRVDPLFTTDILGENPQFKQRGLTRLTEKVYRLQPL